MKLVKSKNWQNIGKKESIEKEMRPSEAGKGRSSAYTQLKKNIPWGS